MLVGHKAGGFVFRRKKDLTVQKKQRAVKQKELAIGRRLRFLARQAG